LGFCGDGVFDAKPILNTIALRIPIIRRGFNKPRRIWSRIRMEYMMNHYSYRLRGIWSINSIGDRLKTKKMESARTE